MSDSSPTGSYQGGHVDPQTTHSPPAAIVEPVQSAEIGEIAAALAKAQGELKNPDRNRTVTVRMKSGGTYDFRYATLDNILAAVRPPLSKNGLAVTQILHSMNGKLCLTTMLMHASGQWLKSFVPILTSEPGPQALGAATTYAKRYALAGICGCAADEDDDGNSAEGNTIQDKTKRATVKRGTAKLAPEQTSDSTTDTASPSVTYIANATDALAKCADLATLKTTWEGGAEHRKGLTTEQIATLTKIKNERKAALAPSPESEIAA